MKRVEWLPVLAGVFVVWCGGEFSGEVREKYARANMKYLQKDTKAALKLFEEVVEEEPNFTNARIMAGKVHYYERRFAKAERVFQEAVDNDSCNSNALFWLSKVQSLNPARQESALENINLLLERDSGNLEAWHIKGLILEHKGKVPEAMRAYRTALLERRKLAMVHFQLAKLYQKAAMNEMALKHLDSAMALSDGDASLQREIVLARGISAAAVAGKPASGDESSGEDGD